MQKMSTCLWFDSQAEEAARFYVSVFKDGKIGRIAHYGKEGFEIHGRPEGSVLTVEFEVNGQKFIALNGGPQFKFDEAVSFVINCETQEEIDYYWSKLTNGGQEGPCGWLKDKFGLSWQVVPTVLSDMMADKDHTKSDRVMKAFLQMKKFDIQKLKEAYA
jgi:predicted 3-demethylubiquinone-9 3-methyltransferase (glyoxalase superfamily)